MSIEITDFPSDPNGETRGLRKELVNSIRKCESFPSRTKLVREILNYAQKHLTAINKQSKSTKEK